MQSSTVGFLGGQPAIDPNDGFISQAVSARAAHDLLSLRLPWWNPYAAIGMPLAGEMQSASFFPPAWLTVLSDGPLYEHVLLELLAGLATLALLTRLGVSRWAATPAAVAFALNGTLACFTTRRSTRWRCCRHCYLGSSTRATPQSIGAGVGGGCSPLPGH